VRRPPVPTLHPFVFMICFMIPPSPSILPLPARQFGHLPRQLAPFLRFLFLLISSFHGNPLTFPPAVPIRRSFFCLPIFNFSPGVLLFSLGGVQHHPPSAFPLVETCPLPCAVPPCTVFLNPPLIFQIATIPFFPPLQTFWFFPQTQPVKSLPFCPTAARSKLFFKGNTPTWIIPPPLPVSLFSNSPLLPRWTINFSRFRGWTLGQLFHPFPPSPLPWVFFLFPPFPTLSPIPNLFPGSWTVFSLFFP